MKKKYALYYFDTLIQQLLKLLPDECHEFQGIPSRDILRQEFLQFQFIVKTTVIAKGRKRDLQIFLSQHYQETLTLMEQIDQKVSSAPDWYVCLAPTIDEIIDILEDICIYFEKRFGSLLGSRNSISKIYAKKQIKQIALQFSEIKQTLPPGPLADELIKHCCRIIKNQQLHFHINKASLNYYFLLLRSLKNWNWTMQHATFSAMECLLIYLNFNSKAAMSIMTQRLQKMTLEMGDTKAQLETFLNLQRTFNQFHRKPGISLNPSYQSLDRFINSWFQAEITFLNQKLQTQLSPLQATAEQSRPQVIPSQREPVRLRCNLSCDQLALIFRAIDEVKLVDARSLNQVYKIIVPFLSTPFRNELSPSSMRVKSYDPEARDKQLVIERLEAMIAKIQNY
ncbi:hypothetical protein [Sphingobacterium zhuxiongii]|uniref:hypothetical protein n=1 Tax=Sphingobacterium zhuxiongii TaxID=2662364 RepID=UPI001886025E|nr:hypothetical protein [Sphingobacterium sp. dk4302]